nr:MAG TPA: protein of unknown function (DUF5492) [Caudoviricetes sp.]
MGLPLHLGLHLPLHYQCKINGLYCRRGYK